MHTYANDTVLFANLAKSLQISQFALDNIEKNIQNKTTKTVRSGDWKRSAPHHKKKREKLTVLESKLKEIN